MTVAISAVFVLLVICAWGMYRRHLRILYFVCSVLLGLSLAGTTVGGAALNGMDMLGKAATAVSQTVAR